MTEKELKDLTNNLETLKLIKRFKGDKSIDWNFGCKVCQFRWRITQAQKVAEKVAEDTLYHLVGEIKEDLIKHLKAKGVDIE